MQIKLTSKTWHEVDLMSIKRHMFIGLHMPISVWDFQLITTESNCRPNLI